MKTVCENLGVARSNIAARAAGSHSRARGRPPLPDRELVEDTSGPSSPIRLPTAIGVSMPSCVGMPGNWGIHGPMPSVSTG